VSPKVVGADADAVVLLLGQHLEPEVTLDFDQPARSVVNAAFGARLSGPAAAALTGVTWLDAGVLSAMVPAHLASGVYDLEVTDPRGRTAALARALEIRPGCPLTYLDLDGDGFGDDGTAAFSCEPGRLASGGDCNGADPLTHPGATEVCNGLDDDCDGAIDEGACPVAAPRWALRPDAGGPAQDWATAWSWARGRLWAAGGSQVWVRQGPAEFRSAATGCPSGLVGSWAAADGWLQVGGGSPGTGRLATALPDGGRGGCFDGRNTTDAVVGVVGFDLPDGGALVRGALRHGVLASWERGAAGPVVEVGAAQATLRLEDLHGSDPDTLYAVGSAGDEGGRMRVLRWTDGGWQDERVTSAVALGPGSLHGVWVLGSDSVFAVGDDGTALEKRDGGWRRLPGLDGGTLQAVRAFGVGRVYAVAREGQVLRWDGRSWAVLRDDGALAPYADLTGVAEDDLWGVGANGTVVHWPE
jgi:hypothetical protein